MAPSARSLRLALLVLLAALHAARGMKGRAGVPDGPEQLRRSAEMGELEKVRKLVLKDKVDPNSAPMFGETPLHWSSQSGHLPVVEELISLGADVRARQLRPSSRPVAPFIIRRSCPASRVCCSFPGHRRAGQISPDC